MLSLILKQIINLIKKRESRKPSRVCVTIYFEIMKKFFFIVLFFIANFYVHSQIVYTDINPDCESTMSSSTFSFFAFNLCPIDFDNNGSNEYSFRWDDFDTAWYVHMEFANDNCEIALNGTSTVNFGRIIMPLQLNDLINNSLTWGVSDPEPFIGLQQGLDSNTNFLNLGDRYIGVKFRIGTNTYFGWVLVNFQTVGGSRKIIVKSYAYNSTPNAQILAGQTNILSLNELSNHNYVHVYPNPSQTSILIQDKLNSTENFNFNILDLTGRIVQNGSSKFNEQIDVEDLISGNYIIQMETKNGEKFAHKFIKN